MTIDTNELRRLAQAATPGPWYVTGKLTRYVEARIDGGLIQEVTACGPTKADGGYGPQQEANARLIAAANPATISELLDRLEAAEKERDALRAEIEAMELECDAMRLNDASVQPELVAVALAACDAVDDLIEKWYATRESGCLPIQVVRARGASKLLRAIALEGTK